MKKILIFIFFSLYAIKASEIKVLLSRISYYKINSEIDNFATKIYGNCIRLRNENYSINELKGRCFAITITNIYNYMPTASKLFNIRGNDTNLYSLVYNLIDIFIEKKSGNIIQIYFKPLILNYLNTYGYPMNDNSFLSLKEKFERTVANIPINILDSCRDIPYKNYLVTCVDYHFYKVYQLLSDDYIIIFNRLKVIQQISDLILESQKTKEELEEKIKEIINKVIKELFTSQLYQNDETNSLIVEEYFAYINTECFNFINYDDMKNCISPKIKEIYKLIPFNLNKNSEWIIDEFMNKFYQSNDKMEKLIKIFLSLKIISSNNNNLRLLTEASTSYSTGLCRWFSFWFCFDEEYCNYF